MQGFTVTGAARLDSWFATWPYAKLSADPVGLSLIFFGRTYNIPKGSIRRLSKSRNLFSYGLRIEHTESSVPGFVVFCPNIMFLWKNGFNKLKMELGILGYEVAA
jgi:hypothetical protein